MLAVTELRVAALVTAIFIIDDPRRFPDRSAGAPPGGHDYRDTCLGMGIRAEPHFLGQIVVVIGGSAGIGLEQRNPRGVGRRRRPRRPRS
jgi:hypothetical protein